MPKMKNLRTGRHPKRKPFWRNYIKRRKKKPKSGLVVSSGPKKHKTEPDHWTPPFAIKKKSSLKADKQDLIVVTEPNGIDLGKVTATVGVLLYARTDYTFQLFVDECLERFKDLDWGGVNEQERWINERRIAAQTGVVCGVYTDLSSGVQIWIATDLDQGITKICLSNER